MTVFTAVSCRPNCKGDSETTPLTSLFCNVLSLQLITLGAFCCFHQFCGLPFSRRHHAINRQQRNTTYKR